MFHNCHRPQYCPLWYFTQFPEVDSSLRGTRMLTALCESGDSQTMLSSPSPSHHPRLTSPSLYDKLVAWLRRRRRPRSSSDQYPQEEHVSVRHGVRASLPSVSDSLKRKETHLERFRRLGKAFSFRHSSLSGESRENNKMHQHQPKTLKIPDVDNDDNEVSDVSSLDGSVFSDYSNTLARSDTFEKVDLTLGDFRIKYSELEFCNLITSSPTSVIHHGRWHGEVVIHTDRPQDDEELGAWLREVRALTFIRHENIVLYMGACVEPPFFAIITSPVTAEDLYSHLVSNRLNNDNKLCILRQTVNAFSYLHAKDIVHGRLSSQNIFLERTVKVSLLDYAPNLPNLQYYAPEVAAKILEGKKANSVKTKEGDIFSFGTLMYQLATGRLPGQALSPSSLQSLVASGDLTEILQSEALNSNLCILIRKCWRRDPSARMTFVSLSRLLQPGNCISKRRSSSEPKDLDTITKTSGLLN